MDCVHWWPRLGEISNEDHEMTTNIQNNDLTPPLMNARILSFFLMAAAVSSTRALPVEINDFVTPYTQDFDTLSATGTSGSLPAGWAFGESGTNQNSTYTAGTGSNNAGDTYSFGAAGASERALGGLQSGTLIPTFGVRFENNTGGDISSFLISFTGEQWRLGALGRADRLDFQYSLDATGLAAGTWLDFDPLDFSAPVTAGGVGALNGNAAANRAVLSGTLAADVADGGALWLRWTDFNAAGSDDGLGIDDFSLHARSASVPETLPLAFPAMVLVGILGWSRCSVARAARR